MSGISQTHTMAPVEDTPSAQLSTWARKQLLGGRDERQQQYGERFGFVKPAEPKVEVRYVPEPKPVDSRTPQEKLEDAETAFLIAQYNVEQAKE